MTADQTVERAANKLQQLAGQMAAEGGIKAKFAQPLAEDADFIRKMKPSLIKARVKGEAPTGSEAWTGTRGSVEPATGRAAEAEEEAGRRRAESLAHRRSRTGRRHLPRQVG